MNSIQSSQAAASTEGTGIRKTVVSRWNKVRFWGTLLVIAFLGLYQWRSSSEDPDNEKVEDFPEVKLTRIGRENGVAKTLKIKSVVVATITNSYKVGMVHGLCGKVTEPMFLADTPKNHIETDGPGERGLTHLMKLTDEVKKQLLKNKTTEVRVVFYLVEKPANDPLRCD